LQILVLVFLGFFSGLIESIGITALVPLFSRLTGIGEANDIISRAIGVFLGWFNQGFGLKALLSFIILTFIFKSIVLVISQYITVKIAANYEKEKRSVLFSKTLNSRWTFLISQKFGHLETILITDVGMSSSLFLSIGAAVVSVASLLVYVIIAFSISPTITMLSLVIGGVSFLILKPFLYRVREMSSAVANANSEMTHHVNENIMGLKTVKASFVEIKVAEAAQKYFNLLRNVNIKVNLLRIVSSAFVEPVSVIFVTVAFAVTYLSGNFQMGIFIATMYLIHRVFQYTQSIQAIAHKTNERIPYLERIIDFEDKITTHKEPDEGDKPFIFKDHLEFSDVEFSYPGKKRKVLSHFTLSVKAGEMIGIIGESGAGKTTIVDLMLRLFEPSSGGILVDGVNIKDIYIKEWRKNIGYVPQDIFVINDTVRANIKFYDDHISEADIERALRMANIYDFIQSLPDKLETKVGERGVLLSGGEKQRLVLARYLARNPKILILDEATSALDNKSELMIQKAIEELKGKITIIVIAHGLSTILNCDNAIFLENGNIKEEGKPYDLLKDKNTSFYKMYNIKGNAN